MKTFGENLKTLRKYNKISQKEFAEALGVSFSTVNRWENGKGLPTFKAMKAIDAFCKERGIDFDIKTIQEV